MTSPLSPARLDNDDGPSYVADPDLMLFQAGDMVSSYTPGFEGAALSGMELADYIRDLFQQRGQSQTNGMINIISRALWLRENYHRSHK